MFGPCKKDFKQLLIDRGIQSTSYVIILSIALLPVVLMYHSIPLLEANSLFELLFSQWAPEQGLFGFGVFTLTSLIMGLCATIISLVVSLSVSLFIYCHKTNRWGRSANRMIMIMSGIPTVAYGFIGVILLVPLIRDHTASPTGFSLLATIVMLAILILPTIVTYINQSFNGLPDGIKTAGLSLGANRYQFFFYILIPTSARGIAIAVLMGFARAISDTMLALMISGNALEFPRSLLASSRSLTAHIGLVLPGEFDGIEFRAVFFASLVLFGLISVFNLVSHIIDRKET